MLFIPVAHSYSVMGKEGIIPTRVELWGPAGTAYLDSLDLAHAYALAVDSLSDLVDISMRRSTSSTDSSIKGWRRMRYRVIQQLNDVGRVHAAVFVAEIGDLHRFAPLRNCAPGRV